jgi:hypothetical protein
MQVLEPGAQVSMGTLYIPDDASDVVRMSNRPISGLLIASQAMAASAVSPWLGADGERERQSQFNNSHSPTQPRSKAGVFSPRG